MDQEKKSAAPRTTAPAGGAAGNSSAESVDDFFNRLQSDMRRPDLSQEAITEAYHSIQRLAMDSEVEDAANTVTQSANSAAGACQACGAVNSPENRFCVACGVPLQEAPPPPGETTTNAAPAAPSVAPGEHHYHHHYHHHYFSGGAGFPAPGAHSGTPAGLGREAVRYRSVMGAASLSRAEAAVRKMSEDWALACNTKQLDDLVSLYAADALVLRANVPPVRGTAAIREFFYGVLDAGLGDIEFEPLRVELFGEVAFESGRCKMLVPTAMGKRREERGKYQMIFIRQSGEWKITTDCWSTDLSLPVAAEGPAAVRPPRK